VTAPGFDSLTGAANDEGSSRLFESIDRFGDRVALIAEDDTKLSYTGLLTLGADLVRPLAGARRLVVIELAAAVEPIAAYVAALRAGHVVIIASEGGGDAGAPISKAFRPELVFSRTGGVWAWQSRFAGPHALHEDLAVLLSTSGSTGSPKLVRLSHAALVANSTAIIKYLDYQPGETAFIVLPLSFSYGMSILNSQLLSGGTLVLNSRSVTEPEVLQRLERHQATSLTGVPHTYELLEQAGFFDTDHPSLRYMACGGGRLAPTKVEAFARYSRARGQRFYVTYGQTEGGPRMAYLPPEDAEKNPDCIGRAIPGGKFRLDNVTAEGVGELVYSGPSVMMGYALSAADLKRGREVTELRTGDLATVNEAGLFRIVGRASRFSKIFGVRIGHDDVERIIADAGEEGAVSGDDEGLVVATPRRGRSGDLRAMLAARLEIPASRIFATEVEAIPRHPSGKVNYPAILKLRPAREGEAPSSLRKEMAEILGVDTVGPDDTFVGLGGDSLSYVQAALMLERVLGHTPANWEKTPFSVLEQAARKGGTRNAVSLEPGVVVRAMAIMFVVVNHVAQLGIGGFATTLLIVAGANFSRFQIPRLLSGGSVELIKSTFVRLVLPYLAVITVYTLAIGQIFWPQFLLYSNFTPGFFVDGQQRFTVYWFIETYIGLVTFAALLFLIPGVRTAARRQPAVFALAGFGLALGLAIAGRSLGELPVFYGHTPVSMAYVFVFGWLVALAKTTAARICLAAGGIGLFWFLPVDGGIVPLSIIGAGLLALLFVRQVPVGRLPGRVLSVLAAASFHIYIFHGFVIHAFRQFNGPQRHEFSALEAPFVVLASVGLGVAVWWAIERVTSRAGPAFPAVSGEPREAPVATEPALHAAADHGAAAYVEARPPAATPAMLRPRLLAYGPAFRRIEPLLNDELDVVLMESGGSLVHEGQKVSAQDAQPEVAWVSQDLFGAPQARDYWPVLLASRRLVWTHSDAAGTDGAIYRQLMKTGTTLTTNDSQAVGIAEYVLGETLCHFQRIAERRAAQAAARWQALPFREISGSRWLVVGFGAIGQAVGIRAKAFGAHVTGVRRSNQPHPAADSMITLDRLYDALPTADVIVLSIPLSPATRHLANEAFFARVKEGAVFVNVGRGGLVDEDALVAALVNGAPGKAVLDVFNVEPLPATSPLWTHERVVVTAHAAAMGAGRIARSDALFLDNLTRFVRLQPLRNEVRALQSGVEDFEATKA
jgi:phosphoglycerate dehydrogenase-like enzyme/acyl-coenzyme A synthetase/AMP-(fatty) acid ligase/peptidoglycan/LPS O-acetylase OafA/YrhL